VSNRRHAWCSTCREAAAATAEGAHATAVRHVAGFAEQGVHAGCLPTLAMMPGIHTRQRSVLRAGCLPTLATIPVFWGLFRTFTNAAASGSFAEGFYFIPSLAGPTLRGAPEQNCQPLACAAMAPAYRTFPCFFSCARSRA
jgi:hypothetical protein